MKKKRVEKNIKTIDELKELQDNLKLCPFCGTRMGIFLDSFGFTLKHQDNRDCECIIGQDSYGWYGRPDRLAEDWNQRKG